MLQNILMDVIVVAAVVAAVAKINLGLPADFSKSPYWQIFCRKEVNFIVHKLRIV